MYENANIETIARGLCIDQGQILICLPRKGGRAYLPGGHIEFAETARQALAREVREELGTEASIGAFLAVAENSFLQKGEPHCEINLFFRMALPALSPTQEPKAQEEWIAFRWIPFTPEAMREANLLPAHLIDDLPRWLETPGQHVEAHTL